MRQMTTDECRRFLSEGTRTAKVATVRADGRPHVVPVWFVLDGDDLVFTTWHTSVKGVNLRRDPRLALCVDDEAPPFAFVQVEGMATLSDGADALVRWATRIGARYMGADQAEAFGHRNGVPGELLVRVTPTRIIGQQEIAEWRCVPRHVSLRTRACTLVIEDNEENVDAPRDLSPLPINHATDTADSGAEP